MGMTNHTAAKVMQIGDDQKLDRTVFSNKN